MDNRVLGIALLSLGIALGVVVFAFSSILTQHAQASCSCTAGVCPHEETRAWPMYAGSALIAAVLALGVYLLVFEKSSLAVASALQERRDKDDTNERFAILYKGLSEEEAKVLRAVRDQDGISQATLRLRTDLHKSKLSIVLDSLEKKGLVARTQKGKTKQVNLKIAF